ncbi:penicillin acylase family protein [Pseudoalteromonas ruthenica]|uniref:penicillin acylase family protein n=1 Tax=Pseudoalteromonas ruthenica TaxID=151081 RepID=UPI00110A71E6|nr:penicillin acylase family protein [Pseudoalteromonas ruthenica]TMO48002.1 peptidase S45 [Pseudoalteromonas ruthenica]TMO49735.1 peptidase S45 [Pseudoalteromonas ruthenica]
MKTSFTPLCLAVISALTLNGCGSDSDDKTSPVVETPNPVQPEPEPKPLVLFDDDGTLNADIRWTTYGVPHIKADNVESLAFGSGYAYAKDNACVLMDQIVKVRGHRSRYFGPDEVPGSGDSAHLISDFGYKALGVNDYAAENYDQLDAQSRAHYQGFVAGFNKYVSDTGADNLAPECASQPWVITLTPEDMLAYSMATVQLASSANFLDLAFYANPGEGDEYLPVMAQSGAVAQSFAANLNARTKTLKLEKKYEHLGSNGWGLGKDKMENGMGGLLANPHFPHRGNLRFWQSHLTIPESLNVMGGSLQGMPGVVNIGFNEHVAWTHTFSKARHFIIYQLALSDNDRLSYTLDGEPMAINSKTINVDVAIAPGQSITLTKDYYYSHQGLMIETPAAQGLGWSDSHAFTIKDANEFNMDVVGFWSRMNAASSLDDMKAAFAEFDGVSFNNTMAADKHGNAFFIDDSTVLKVGETANLALRLEPQLVALREQTGFDLVPGDTSLFAADGVVPYAEAPKLERSDYVQNSNDSYWLTNPEQPLSGFAAQYGDVQYPQSLRTRMGLKLLREGGGEDGKFSLAELEQALIGNDIYLYDLVFPELVNQCQAQGSEPINLAGRAVDLSDACALLAQFDGKMTLQTKGAALIREFAHLFDPAVHLFDNFSSIDAANTPNTLRPDGSALQALAHAVLNVTDNGFALDATLGELQFVEKTLAGGMASGEKLPWAGPMHVEGGFNVFRFDRRGLSDSTVIPYVSYPALNDAISGAPLASNLSASGYPINYGSSWMFVMNFTENGPVAKGLLTMSQSAHSDSPHFDDQSRYYSQQAALRPLYFSEGDISNNLIAEMSISLEKPSAE